MWCSICSETYNETSLLRCGHSFCRGCIGRELEKPGDAGLPNCPTCETLPFRPQGNRTCRMAFHFMFAPQDDDTTGIVFTCNQSPIPTIKFCPQDGGSLCFDHLMALSKSPGQVQPNVSRCPIHMRPNTFHCLDDDTNICAHCISRLHRGHRVESVYEASMKKKEPSSSKSQDLVEHQPEPSGLVTKVSLLFQELRKHLEDLEKKVLSKVFGQVEQVSAPCHDDIQELDSKKDESKTILTIKEPCTSSYDPSAVSKLKEPESGDGDVVFQDAGEAPHLDAALILHYNTVDVLSADCNGCFMNREVEILLDEDTAGNNIDISFGISPLSSIYWKEDQRPKPKTPKRFRNHQVLSETIFSKGRHFWTLETSKWGSWRFGVAYPSIARKGFRSYVGCSDKSWVLCKWRNQYSAMHACKVIELPDELTCQRFGVYLDYEAGHLSFHELSVPVRHLHTFTTTFTEPLHAVFSLWVDSHGDAWMLLNQRRPYD
ncbi:E3 ubiquitin-protein ligase TRIM7-like [Engystomops pustulosus]|uniref:E3 ubiquitin-protein ligase TRIM7-like n=1 Tax=Engystomops pustulosus TaxID=76066 RepID=UPI003AFB320E